MPTFSSPESFKEHSKYVPLLKKALLTAKPDTQKKILYFNQYPFGPKKLPLVLVDFEPGCPAAVAKAGHKPSAEGLVSLTPQDELNFEAKKDNVKRIRIKKYFATLGGGIKPVYLPPGETGQEDQVDAVTPPGAPQSVPEDKAPGSDDNELKRRELMARIQELQDKSFPLKIEALKKPVLAKASSLVDASKFPEATLLLQKAKLT